MVSTLGLIDSRNQKLWDDINSNFLVTVEASSNNEYSCYCQSDNVTFYVPAGDINSDSMTHEMLHVYLRMKEVYIGPNLTLTLSGSRILSKIFTPVLLEHISNSLDHIKMLPIYLNLGYRREKFLLDYGENKCTEKELSDIRRYYKQGKQYDSNAINLFIGKYFAVVSDPNDSLDYSKALVQLRKVDEQLFNILKTYENSWRGYDIDNSDVFNSYRDITDSFYQMLKKWMTNKTIL